MQKIPTISNQKKGNKIGLTCLTKLSKKCNTNLIKCNFIFINRWVLTLFSHFAKDKSLFEISYYH